MTAFTGQITEERVAIVGSRGYQRLDLVTSYVESLGSNVRVVTGGARGVDTAAEVAAMHRALNCTIFEPDYEQHGRRAPLERNKLIVDECDRLVAFWDGKSTGTMHTVGLARKAGKPVEIIR